MAAIAAALVYVLTGSEMFSANLVATTGASFLITFGSLFLSVSAKTRSNQSATWSMWASAVLFVLLVENRSAAACGAIAASLVYDLILHRKQLRGSAINAFTILLAVASASLVFELLGGTPGSVALPGSYLPILGAAIVFGLASELLQAVSYAVLTPGGDPIKLLRSDFANIELQSTLIECFVGVAAAIVYMVNPWALPVMLPLGLSLVLAMQRGNRVQQVTERALESFANIVDERDRYTAEHSSRVCDYSVQIGERLGLSDKKLTALYWTSRLHDLGKVAVDNAILNKPGKLTDEEFDIMKTHPVVSARLLSSFSFDDYDTDVVLCHHERYDGYGYLRRDRDSVPFEAFIIAVADSFDAMTSDRPYRKALPREFALNEIYHNLGSQFHPVAGRAFLETMDFDFAAVEQAPDEHREAA